MVAATPPNPLIGASTAEAHVRATPPAMRLHTVHALLVVATALTAVPRPVSSQAPARPLPSPADTTLATEWLALVIPALSLDRVPPKPESGPQPWLILATGAHPLHHHAAARLRSALNAREALPTYTLIETLRVGPGTEDDRAAEANILYVRVRRCHGQEGAERRAVLYRVRRAPGAQHPTLERSEGSGSHAIDCAAPAP